MGDILSTAPHDTDAGTAAMRQASAHIQAENERRDRNGQAPLDQSEQLAIEDIYKRRLGLTDTSGVNPYSPDINLEARLHNPLAEIKAQDQAAREGTLLGRVHNAGLNVASNFGSVGTELLGVVAPETANDLHQEYEAFLNANKDSRSGKAGNLAAEVAKGIVLNKAGPAALGAGFGLLGFGGTRRDIDQLRHEGHDISTGQELATAAGVGTVQGVASMVLGKIWKGLTPEAVGAAKAAGQQGVQAYIKGLLQQALPATGAAFKAGTDMVVMTAISNKIMQGVDPKRAVTDGLLEAGATGILLTPFGAKFGEHGTAQRPGETKAGIPAPDPAVLQSLLTSKPEANVPEANARVGVADAPQPAPVQVPEAAPPVAPGTPVPADSGVQPGSGPAVSKPALDATAAKPLTAKYRLQEGGKSRGVELTFDSARDHALFVATEARKGKRQAEARTFLKGQGFNDDAIQAYGGEVRDRVDQLAEGIPGDTLRVPATEAAGAGKPAEGVGGVRPVEQGPVAPTAAAAKPAAEGVAEVRPVDAPLPHPPELESDPHRAAMTKEVLDQAMNSMTEEGAAPKVDTVGILERERATRAPLPRSGDIAANPVVDAADTRTRLPSSPVGDEQVEAAKRAAVAEHSKGKNLRFTNPPDRMSAQTAESIRSISGRRVVWVEGAGSSFVMSKHPGVLFISNKMTSVNAAEHITHELWHKVQESHPELARSVEAAFPAEEHAAAGEKYVKGMLGVGLVEAGLDVQNNPEKLARESGATLVGKAVRNPEVLRGLTGEKKGVVRTVVDKMLEFLGVKPKLSPVEVKVRDGLVKVREALMAEKAPAEPATAGEISHYPAQKFVEDDAKPALKAAGEAVDKAWEGVKSLVAPHARTRKADRAKGIMRERGADLAQRYDRLGEAFNDARKAFEKVPTAQSRQFIADIEAGKPQTDPKLQPIADAVRAILDDRLKQVQALGTGKLSQFVEDYFPHLWKDPAKAGKVFREGKAPLEGGKGFIKKRSLPTLADGLAKGLEPVTENPIEAMMLRVREMDKYITAHESFKEMQDKGLLKKARARDVGKWGQKGYSKINDNIATIYAKPSRRGALQIQGYYMAPEAVANVINNYLSPGIRGNKYFGAAFRGYLGAGNVMNQVQLGMSFFHALNTSLDSATSSFALGLMKGSRGDIKGGAAEIGKALTLVKPMMENWKQGTLLLKEWHKPGSTTPEIAAIVDLMKAAGGRAKMDDFYHTGWRESFKKAWNEGNVVGSLFRLPMAAIEASAAPVMEKMVPRMKMGVFFKMAQFELDQLGPNASRDEMRKAAGRAWDSVDNRMGELVYDNLFWNKAVKDLAMASTRSVGWNLGSWRELAGGGLDAVKAGKNLVTGRQAEFTHRMSYLVAMPVMAGFVGGIVHYLLNREVPKELKDWFFPKTGEKDKDGHDVRLSLPSYMKDVYAYGEDPVGSLTNKSHPMLNTIMEMLSNKDYYNTKIRNEDDPYVQQALDLAKHAGKSFVPFGLREVSQLKDQGQGARSLLPLIGIVKAKKDVTHSKAELLMQEMMADKMPKGTRTKEEADRSQLIRDLSDRFKETGDSTEIGQAIKEGRIPESALEQITERQHTTGFERGLKRLDAGQIMKVWDVATPEERKGMVHQVVDKVHEAKGLTEGQKSKLLARLVKDIDALNL
jgi:hypothetical protein